MRKPRRHQLRYGLPAGFLAFLAGWGITAYVTPTGFFANYPRWRSTLWAYLGTHNIELSSTYTDGFGFASSQVVTPETFPSYVFLIPIVAVSVASFYTTYEISSSRIKHNISNSLAAGTGYFLTGLGAMIVSDIRPSISMILVFALLVGGGIWVGSSLAGFLTRGMPFIGIASLGSIAALGILAIMGGIALLSSVVVLVAISFGVAGIVGFSVGFTRRMERRGRGNDRFRRLYGFKTFLIDYWKAIVASGVVAVVLYVGLEGGIN